MTNSAETDVLQPALSRHFGDIQRIAETGSTNEDLLTAPFAPEPAAPVLRWAGHQNRGRGRLDRQWIDQVGKSLTFSVCIERPVGDKTPPPVSLPLVAAVALSEAIIAQLPESGANLRVKWPNDLIVPAGKVAGILVETRRHSKTERLVIGCGVNVRSPAISIAQSGHLPAAGLIHEDQAFSDQQAQAMVAAMAQSLVVSAMSYFDQGFGDFKSRWQSLDAFAGQSVQLLNDGQQIANGIARGIDDQGALLIEVSDKIRAYAIGELSVRPKADADTSWSESTFAHPASAQLNSEAGQ